jgi:site-specific recombinase XerD
VDLEDGSLKVLGKFRRERITPLGRKCVGQMAKYLKLRSKHDLAEVSDALWFGDKHKPLTDSGVRQMLNRRTKKAGISHLHPHMLRRYFCVSWMSEGGSETGLMTVAGWKGTQMIRHYSGNKNAILAQKEHKRLSPGDRL